MGVFFGVGVVLVYGVVGELVVGDVSFIIGDGIWDVCRLIVVVVISIIIGWGLFFE